MQLFHTCTVVTLSLAMISTNAMHAQVPAPHWRGTVDLTIGGGIQPVGPYMFEEVRGLSLDPLGRILVSDYKGGEVRVFSSDGKVLYTIGKPGAGPGDLREPCCIAFAPDGKLWVKDRGNRRYSVFTLGPTRAAFDYSVRTPDQNGSFMNADHLTWNRAGQLVDLSAAGMGARSALVRTFIDSSGRSRGQDTIMPPPTDSLSVFMVTRSEKGGGTSTQGAGQPFGASRLRAQGPNGEFAAAVTTNYAVSWFDADHHRIALLQQKGEGPLLTPRERAMADTQIQMDTKRLGQKLPFTVPTNKSVLYNVAFDLDGRLWVQREVNLGAPSEADIYDRSGRLLATVEWPENVEFLGWAIHGKTGIGIVTDRDDVQRIVRVQFK